MTTARSTVGVAVLNGRLYAVGGRDGSACLNSVECYDPHTNKWRVTCPMLKRRGGKDWRNCVAQIEQPSTVKIACCLFRRSVRKVIYLAFAKTKTMTLVKL